MRSRPTIVDPHQQRRTEKTNVALVAIAGSAGAIEAMRCILSQLPADFPVPILYLQHMSPSRPSRLRDVLQYGTALSVRWAQPLIRPERGVNICPPGYFFTICADGTLSLTPIKTSNDLFHSVDQLFSSVAEHYAQHAVTVLLSGAGRDGT